MKTKAITLATLALAATFFLSSDANAFWGGGQGKGQGFTQERFEEMKQLFLNNDFESFRTAMEAKREEMKVKHEEMKGLRESIDRSVENIENGVIVTLTSDNADAVEHLQSKDQPEPRHEGVTKVVENLENGIRMTITSTDADEVARIQARHSGEKEGRGWKKGGKMGKRGFGKGGRFGHNMGQGNSQDQ